MNFEESEKYLYSLGNEVSAMKLGLDNIRTLLDALGNPEKEYLKVQIAGTNGKGSTCAFLESICLAAGIKTGMTTSPHLVSIRERVKINGREISEKDFAKCATIVRNASETLVAQEKLENVPTYFEQVTATALLAFAETNIELAILETGLGGRFDATTAANAEIVAITPIDFDHQKILGDTLAEIAAEKAAIIRADTKVIVAGQKAEAENVIKKVCDELKVNPQKTNFKSEIIEITAQGKYFVNFETDTEIYENVKVNLAGKHQIENAKVAILLAESLQNYFPISKENIRRGLQSARHKGRLEFVENFLFDGAHNLSGARALREFLDGFIKQKILMIFGAMRDKDLTEIAGVLFPRANKIIFTVPDNERSMPTEKLLSFAPQEFDKANVLTTENAAEALEKAEEISAKDDLILVTGSLYLVGEAQKILQKGK